jgi:hypothetical protein
VQFWVPSPFPLAVFPPPSIVPIPPLIPYVPLLSALFCRTTFEAPSVSLTGWISIPPRELPLESFWATSAALSCTCMPTVVPVTELSLTLALLPSGWPAADWGWTQIPFDSEPVQSTTVLLQTIAYVT